MSIDWSTFEAPTGEFNRWKPETPGDKIHGKITSLRIATMPDGRKLPALTIATDLGDRDMLASQTVLLRLLAEKKPTIGDIITIVYEREERLANGRTLKHFNVELVKGKPITADEVF